MNGRVLAGKTIRRLHQVRVNVDAGKASRAMEWSVDAIEFTDGTFLRFQTIETEGEYGTALVYPAAGLQKDGGR